MTDDGWIPIEMAPTDVRVDVWVRRVGSAERGHRVPDCTLRPKGTTYPYWTDRNGWWFTGRRVFLDDDVHYDPSLADDGSTIVTHWRPRPAPPAEGE